MFDHDYRSSDQQKQILYALVLRASWQIWQAMAQRLRKQSMIRFDVCSLMYCLRSWHVDARSGRFEADMP